MLGSSRGTVGRVVTSDTSKLQLVNSHRQFLLSVNEIEKMKIKKKRLGSVDFPCTSQFVETLYLPPAS